MYQAHRGPGICPQTTGATALAIGYYILLFSKLNIRFHETRGQLILMSQSILNELREELVCIKSPPNGAVTRQDEPFPSFISETVSWIL